MNMDNEHSQPLAPGSQSASLNDPSEDRETVERYQDIDRVMDVPLGVTLRFGQRTMPLREVLELAAGSLIELDRRVEEPVDLLIGERLLARGEVVIVDGNYGLRVSEVVGNVEIS